jgi:hypothetical protein
MDQARVEFVTGVRAAGRKAVVGLAPQRQRVELFPALPMPVLTAGGLFPLTKIAFRQVVALAVAGTADLVLDDGSLLDLFGDAVSFTSLKLAHVQLVAPAGGAEVAAGTQITIGAAATNPHPLFFGAAAHTHRVTRGGPPYQGGDPAGVAVSGGANRVRLTNTGSVAATVAVLLGGD